MVLALLALPSLVAAEPKIHDGSAAEPETADATDESQPAPGAHTHDGFFIRLAPGVGYSIATAEIGGVEYTYRGGGPVSQIAIGGAIFENFILHFTALFASIVDPELEVKGVVQNVDSRLEYGGAAAGITYYFMPINFYVSGSLGVAALNRRDSEDEAKLDIDPGFVIDFTFGKEWWVSDNWGLGVAGQTTLAVIPVNDYEWTTFTAAILFSATYN